MMTSIVVEQARAYVEPFYTNRPWHNMNHINKMLAKLTKQSREHPTLYSITEIEDLQIAILFHDIIYDPRKADNEEKSVEFMKKHLEPWTNKINGISSDRIDQIGRLILATKNHEYKSGYYHEQTIIELDLQILDAPMSELVEWEHGIFKEYQWAPVDVYIRERVKFLEKYVNRPNKDGSKDSRIKDLVEYVKTRKYKIGIYPGSFNPFHIGHLDILKQAEEAFDKVIVARGINPDKDKLGKNPLPKSITDCLDENFKWNGAREVVEYSGLVTDFFKSKKENVELFLIRGLRNAVDVAQEENFRKVVHDIDSTIKFAYFFSELSHISSSMIRGLMPFDKEKAERYIVI